MDRSRLSRFSALLHPDPRHASAGHPYRGNCSEAAKAILTSPPCRKELRKVNLVGAFSLVTRLDGLLSLEGNEK
jgi:hypothetical protein